jgi:predicted amidohydrolase YtcJ
VVLDKNPLKVEPTAIKDIKVVETIKEGKTIYRAPEG